MAGPPEIDTEPPRERTGTTSTTTSIKNNGNNNININNNINSNNNNNDDEISFNEAFPPGNYRIGHLMNQEEFIDPKQPEETGSILSKLGFIPTASEKLCPSDISALDDLEKELNETESTDFGHGHDESSDTTYAGEVQVSLKYDHELNVLTVRVHKAQNLQIFGSKSSIDPYAKIYLTSTTFPRMKQRTKAVKNTLAPVFEEVLTFPIAREDLFTSTCCISIWHYDFLSENIPLGDAYINMEEFIEAGFSLDVESPQWYTLHGRVQTPFMQLQFNGYLRVVLQYCAPGSVETDMRVKKTNNNNPTKGLFCVRILEVRDFETSFNPIYFKLILVVAGSKSLVMKSDTVPVSNATWNEYFDIEPISWAELESAYLQISLKGKGHRSHFISGARLGLGKLQHPQHDSFGTEVKAWQTMLDNPNESRDFWIPLRSNLNSVKKATFVPPPEVTTMSEEEYEARQRLESEDNLSLDSMPSRLSAYSVDGETDGRFVPTGVVFLSVRHSVNSNRFHVNIMKAQNIACVDVRRNTSNPYVKTYLLPDADRTTKKTTSHKLGTATPMWNETVTYDISREELQRKVLRVSVWNYDKFERNDFLGDVLVNMKQYGATNDLSVATPVWYSLQETPSYCVGGGVNGILMGTAPKNPAEQNVGEIQVGVGFEGETLSVHVKQASGLHPVVLGEIPNPFVRCYLLPVVSLSGKRKTTIKRGTLQPVWNELFKYSGLTVQDLYTSVLEVTVWHAHPSGHHFMGGVRLGLSGGTEEWQDCFGKEVVVWETMLRNLGMVSETTIPLRSMMQTRRGLITEDTIATALDKTTDFLSTASESQLLPTVRLSMKFEETPTEKSAPTRRRKKVKGNLHVMQISASNLPSDYTEDAPSTFCEGRLRVKGKKIPKYKTDVYLKSPNPKWTDEVMSFTNITLEDLPAAALEIVIYDQISIKQEEMIGFIRLAESNVRKWADSSGKEVGMWRSLLNNPNRMITEDIPLRVRLVTPEEEEELGDGEDELSFGSAADVDGVKKESEQEEVVDTSGRESPRTAALRAMGVGGASDKNQTMSQCMVYANDLAVDTESVVETKAREAELQVELLSRMKEEAERERKALELLTPPTVREGGLEFNEDELRQKAKGKSTSALPTLAMLKTEEKAETGDDGEAGTEKKEPGGGKITYIRGELQFSARYDHSFKAFELHVHQGRMVTAINKVNETSNTFCKAYLLPDTSKAGKQKTGIRMDTINPEWDQLLEFSLSLRDLRTRILWISVWHCERLRPNIFLGEVMLEMDQTINENDEIKEEFSKPAWYTLQQKTPTHMRMVSKGYIRFSILFEDKRLRKDQTKKERDTIMHNKGAGVQGKIHIHLKGCASLPAADSTGLSDPYCVCNLLPLKPRKYKKVTPVIRYTLNPEWDYRFEYECDYDYLSEHGVEFTVMDWDRATSNDFLGFARINLGNHTHKLLDAEGPEIDVWQHLIDSPNLWKEFVIPLQVKACPNGRTPKVSVPRNMVKQNGEDE